MQIRYAVSLINYTNYVVRVPSIERIIPQLAELNFGTEIWSTWADELDLFDEVGRERLKIATKGIEVSLHGGGWEFGFKQHKKQIDTAAYIGAEVIVVHDYHFALEKGSRDPDTSLARDAVSYASEHGVRLALENSGGRKAMDSMAELLEEVDGLACCLDTGHLYVTGTDLDDRMRVYLDIVEDRLIHLHLNEIWLPVERELDRVSNHHLPLGTGGIPREDWQLLIERLRQIDYQGMGVFEIGPRNPKALAVLSKLWMEENLGV